MSTLDVDGVSLAYEEEGQGAPVLLIHGTAASLWGELPGMLADEHRVITYDRRSFGASRHEPLASPQRHVADAAALIEHTDAAPATIVGWSGGGILALELAATRPELVAGLVLVEPPLHASRRPSLSQAMVFGKAMAMRKVVSHQAGTEIFLRWAAKDPAGGSILDRLPPNERLALMLNSPAIQRELDAGTGEHLSNGVLESVGCPAEVLLSDSTDPVFARSGRLIESALPNARRVEVPGASHFMQIDRPDAIADAVRRVSAGAAAKPAVAAAG